MKKLAFLFTAIVAVSFASCGNKAAQQAEEAEAVEVEAVEEEAVDTISAGDSIAVEVVEAPEAE